MSILVILEDKMQTLQHWWEFQQPMKLVGKESLMKSSELHELESDKDSTQNYDFEKIKNQSNQVLAQNSPEDEVSIIV